MAEEREQAQLAEEEDQQRKRIEILKITNPDLYVALYAADEEVLPLARPVERRRIFQRVETAAGGASRIGTEPTVADVSAVTRGFGTKLPVPWQQLLLVTRQDQPVFTV